MKMIYLQMYPAVLNLAKPKKPVIVLMNKVCNTDRPLIVEQIVDQRYGTASGGSVAV
jgi:hypothetical protein